MICNCGTITTKLTYFWECKSCGRIDWHTKKTVTKKPVMRSRTKIYRILKNSTTLDVIETEFLMKMKHMLTTGKDKLISDKQGRWLRRLIMRENNNI